METTAYKLHGSDFYIVRKCIEAPAAPPPEPTHHVLVLDCSGSMAGVHAEMRRALSEKLYTLVGEEDVVSVVWFSGRSEHGVIVERAPVPTLKEVQKLQKLFDRWIRPVGLTGFQGPLADVRKVLEGRAGEKVSLFFLSDGFDNQSSRAEIMAEIDALAPKLSAATIVEFGYYADRALLTKMAERFGGSLVFAEDFAGYEPLVEAALGEGGQGGPTVDVACEGALRDVSFALYAQSWRVGTFEVAGGKSTVHEAAMGAEVVAQAVKNAYYETVEELAAAYAVYSAAGFGGLYYLTRTPPKGARFVPEATAAMVSALYAALSIYAARLEPEIIYAILRDLGDVSFIEDYGTLFGKQAHTDFMRAAVDAAFEPGLRLSKGHDRAAVPADDAYTILDLLTLLSTDERCRVLLDHPSFKYSRISRGRDDATEGEQLRFVGLPKPEGYFVDHLTWNEDRANVSILVRRTGTVDLSGRLPFTGKVPEKFDTYVWRNYAIVKDGIRNVSTLVVRVPIAMADTMRVKGCKLEQLSLDGDMATVQITLDRMPVLNRTQVKRAGAKELFAMCASLEELRAKNKVLKAYVTEERRSAAWDERYGKEAADWLRAQGLTEWGGYQPPKTKQSEASDYYMGKLLEVKIKGWSSLPPVKDVISGKAKNAPALWMRAYVQEVEIKKASLGNKFDAWVSAQQKAIQCEVTALIREVAKLKFAVIVSGMGFAEFPDVNAEMRLPIQIAGAPGEAVAVMSEEKIYL
jgi:hypothetical protein